MRIPKRIVQLPRNIHLHNEDVFAIVDQNNRTSKISLLQLAEFLSGTTRDIGANDFVTEGEYDDIEKKVTLTRSDGEQIRITGFTGGDQLYRSLLDPDIEMVETIGGLEEGTKVSDLSDGITTLSDVFDALLFPTADPVIDPAASTSLDDGRQYGWIGETLNLTLVTGANKGLIKLIDEIQSTHSGDVSSARAT